MLPLKYAIQYTVGETVKGGRRQNEIVEKKFKKTLLQYYSLTVFSNADLRARVS